MKKHPSTRAVSLLLSFIMAIAAMPAGTYAEVNKIGTNNESDGRQGIKATSSNAGRSNTGFPNAGFGYETVVSGYKIRLTAEAGVLPDDTQVVIREVTEIGNQEIKGLVENGLPDASKVQELVSFDISLYSNGKEIQPEDGVVKVSIDLAGEVREGLDAEHTDVKVFHIENVNHVEEVSVSMIDNSRLEYEAGSFSIYAVAITEDTTTIIASGTQGDSITWTFDSEGLLAYNGTGEMGAYRIGDVVFPNQKIKKAVISEGITSICNQAFTDARYLTNVTIPNSVTSIGFSAFSMCGNLASISIPDGVTSIDVGVFYACSSLTDIVIPNSVTSIGVDAFRACSGLTSITMSENLTMINVSAFEDCSNLKTIKIPKGIISIENFAFQGCKSLTKVELPEGLTFIKEDVFEGCSSLKEIEIPESVTSIGRYAFSGCGNLASIRIPQSVTAIGEYAFNGCNALKDIYYAGSQEQWGFIDGIDTLDENIAIHYNSSINDNANIISSGQCGENATWKLYDNGTILIDGTGDMDNYDFLTKVFEDCPWHIYNSEIKEIHFNGNITSIGTDAFRECKNISQVSIPSGITSIGSSAFRDCTSLSTVYIPDSVKIIEIYAFLGCDNLKDIYFSGTQSAWEAITGEGKTFGSNVTIHFSSEADKNNGLYKINMLDETYTIKEGDSGIAFVNAYDPTKDLATYLTWKTQDSDIVSLDYNENLDMKSIKVIIPAVSSNNTYNIQTGIKFYAKSIGETTITCAMADGTNASINIIVIASDSNEDSPVSNNYNVKRYNSLNETDAQKKLKEDVQEWEEAYDNYKSILSNIIHYKDGVDIDIENAAINMMNSAATKNTLLPDANFPSEWKLYAYEALCSVLFEISDTKADIKDIKISNKSKTNLKITETICKSLILFKNKKYNLNNIKFTIEDLTGITVGNVNAFSGSMKYSGRDPETGKTVRGTIQISSDISTTNKAISNFLDSLYSLGRSAVINVYEQLILDLCENTLDELLTKLAKNTKSRLYFDKYKDKLKDLTIGNIRVGNVYVVIDEAYKYYETAKKLYDDLSISSPEDFKGALDTLSDLKFDDEELIEDKLLEKAYDKLKDAKANLEADLFDYVYNNGTINSKSWIGQLIGKKYTNTCPTNISIYDSSGVQVGYIGNDSTWCVDELSVEEIGGAKIIYAPKDIDFSFEFEGTDVGEMGWSVEEYENNEPTGRLNFYNIPLYNGVKYTYTDISSIAEGAQTAEISSEENAFNANEYIPATESAGIEISVSSNPNKGGEAWGDGIYVRGDAVVLRANPANGYAFKGWYSKSNELLSTESTFEFMAKENGTYKAEFEKYSENTSSVFEQGICGEDAAWILDKDNILRIMGNGEISSSVFWDADTVKGIIIESGITSIAAETFKGFISLESVTIPSTVTSIGTSAFEECAKIKDVEYDGTEAQWKAISITSGNESILKTKANGTPTSAPTATPTQRPSRPVTRGGSGSGGGSSSGGSSSGGSPVGASSVVPSQASQASVAQTTNLQDTPGSWKQEGDSWFYMKRDGSKWYGWIVSGHQWYYMNTVNGAMLTGWKFLDNKWYYFHTVSDGSKGRMWANARTPDGYYVDSNGVWDGKSNM